MYSECDFKQMNYLTLPTQSIFLYRKRPRRYFDFLLSLMLLLLCIIVENCHFKTLSRCG